MSGSSKVHPHVRVLGEFQVTCDEEVLALSAAGQRVVGCLAVLHRQRPVRRATIADRLWPDAPPARAASNLRSVLWRLPRPRGRLLVKGGSATIVLHDDVQVDLWESEEVAAAICARDDLPGEEVAGLASLEQDLLPDWDEDWLVMEREAFRQLRLHALEHVAAASCDRGRFTDALSAGLCAVRSEPLRESAHRLVIAVHLAEGNFAEALRQYDGYRRLLAHELGLPPSPAIRRLVAPLLGRPLDLG